MASLRSVIESFAAAFGRPFSYRLGRRGSNDLAATTIESYANGSKTPAQATRSLLPSGDGGAILLAVRSIGAALPARGEKEGYPGGDVPSDLGAQRFQALSKQRAHDQGQNDEV